MGQFDCIQLAEFFVSTTPFGMICEIQDATERNIELKAISPMGQDPARKLERASLEALED